MNQTVSLFKIPNWYRATEFSKIHTKGRAKPKKAKISKRTLLLLLSPKAE